MNDLSRMYRDADEEGEATARIDGYHVDDLRIEVMTAGYVFKTDGDVFSVVKNKRQPINYARAGTV